MISPGPGLVIEKGQLTREGISHVHRTQQPLRVAMHRQNVIAVAFGQQALKRLPLPLQPVNGACLLPVLVNRQHDAAIQKLFIDFDGRRRQKDHHRTFDAILVRDQTAVGRVFAGRSDGQLSFALQ